MMTFGAGVPKAGMMEIGIALVLHDRFSNQAAMASKHIRQLQQEAKMAVQANLTQAYQFGQMGLNAFRTMATGIADMISYGAEFVDTMTTVEAITEATTESMGKLKDIAMSLGATTMFSSQDVASGMKYLAMAGNSAEQIQAMIKSATYAAGATGMALGGKGGAADVITNVMRTFRLSGEEAAFQVGDVMTNATLSANISMQDLAASIRYAAADMTNLGYDLPQVSAAIGTLGNMGIQGSMAGTALANMARYLNRSISDPSYKGHKFLDQLGLNKSDLTTAEGQLKDLYSIMKMIKNATADMDPTDRNLVTTGIFGVRGNRAAVAMMRDLENYQKLYQDLAQTQPGFAQGVVEKRMSTVAGQLNAMKSTWENLKAAFTEALSGTLIPVFKFITNWLNGMKKILGTGIGKFLAGLTLISTALLGIGSAILVIRTRFMMLQTDSRVTGQSMFQVLVGGWRHAYLAAADYARMEGLIIAQRKAGIMANPGMLAMGAGYTVGGIKQVTTVGRNGRAITRYRDMNTGRFVSAAAAAGAASAAGAGALTKSVVGGGLRGVGSLIGKVAKGALRFLGGPWGIALTVISFLLPSLIGAINRKRNTNSQNTSALQENTAAANALTNQYASEKNKVASEKSQKEQDLTTIANLLKQLYEKETGRSITLNLKVNGVPRNSVMIDDNDNEVMFDTSLQ